MLLEHSSNTGSDGLSFLVARHRLVFMWRMLLRNKKKISIFTTLLSQPNV